MTTFSLNPHAFSWLLVHERVTNDFDYVFGGEVQFCTFATSHPEGKMITHGVKDFCAF